MEKVQWKGFTPGAWQQEINVRDFIQKNYTPYEGDESFLAGPTPRTQKLMKKLNALFALEAQFGGVLDIDTQHVTSLTNYEPGYLDREEEIIVGLQTDRPLRRGVNPFGGINMTRKACKAYGYKLSDTVEQEFLYRTTHNDGVFRVYTDEIKAARHCGIITGLPDAYGRGRIIGDYRRVALYGVDYLIECKKEDKRRVGERTMDQDTIRQLERAVSADQLPRQAQGRWPPCTAMTSPSLPATRGRRCSGSTLPIWARSRSRTARP